MLGETTHVHVVVAVSTNIVVEGKDFNGLIGKVAEEEKEVHKRLLEATKDTEVPQAYNHTLERIRYIEGKRQVKIAVNLVPKSAILEE